jgi:hypothetical protein
MVPKIEKTESFTKNGNFYNFHDIKKAHGAEWGSEIFTWLYRYTVQDYLQKISGQKLI